MTSYTHQRKDYVDGTQGFSIDVLWSKHLSPEHLAQLVKELRAIADGIATPVGKPTRETPVWVSVEERLPEVNKHVLAYERGCSRGEMHVAECETHGGFAITGGGDYAYMGKVSHWMLLPQPPEVSNDD